MESMRWVGVDVHAKESLAAVLDRATGEINRKNQRPTRGSGTRVAGHGGPAVPSRVRGRADGLWTGPASSRARS
jgi:hypothetical protein